MNSLLIILASIVGIKGIVSFAQAKKKKFVYSELDKYDKTDNIEFIECPDELFLEETNDFNFDNKVNFNYIKKVYDVLSEKFSDEELKSFNHNLKSLNINNLDFKLILKFFLKNFGVVGGGYNSLKNELLIGKINEENIYKLLHEILHIASTYYDEENNIVYSGFSQMYIFKDKKKVNTVSFGLGINEGMTQYFVESLFKDDLDKMSPVHMTMMKYIYKPEKIIARDLCIIFGEDKILSLYLKGDSKGLFDLLTKYSSREDVTRFINLTDILCGCQVGHKNYSDSRVNEAKRFVNSFIYNLFVKRLEEKGYSDDVSHDVPDDFIPYECSNGMKEMINTEDNREYVKK